MNPTAISSTVFACVFGGAVIGMFLRPAVPRDHLSADSKGVVGLGMGLVATMSALVLGLLVNSAKSFYDTQSTELTDTSAKIVLLDRVLAHYGPQATETRDLLRGTVVRALDRVWSKDSASPQELAPSSTAEILFDKIQGLSPEEDDQRWLKAQALSIVTEMGQTRWLQYAQTTTSVPMPLLAVLVSWLTTLFISFGLFAPRNGTVVISLLVSALSVSTAILLMLEFYTPYAGLIQVSSAPLRDALMQLGK